MLLIFNRKRKIILHVQNTIHDINYCSPLNRRLVYFVFSTRNGLEFVAVHLKSLGKEIVLILRIVKLFAVETVQIDDDRSVQENRIRERRVESVVKGRLGKEGKRSTEKDTSPSA